MALYDGFFDGIEDGVHEDGTTKYDREYESSDFTNYFGQIVGSGVCIHDNPDSFKAEFEDGVLYLRPGYLFIRGYWLANVPGEDGDPASYKGYVVTLPAAQTGPVAVVAHLNLGQKIIEIETRSVSQAYPDSLVLAIVDASVAEDTRHNTDICGVIDSAGALSGKVEYAIDYINNEIDGKLEQIEQDIAEHELKLDAKIAEAQEVVDKIAPPPVGTIKFSASQDVGDEWLRCDGSFVNETDYPELVAALGKLTPSADKFQVISDNEIGTQISNGVVYDGRMWVYSYATKKLYGVDLDGTAAVKEITLTSESEYFSDFIAPGTVYPICLSIVPHKVGTGAKLFLAQFPDNYFPGKSSGAVDDWEKYLLIFQSEFSGNESALNLEVPFISVPALGANAIDTSPFMPYVISTIESGMEKYFCALGLQLYDNGSDWYYFVYLSFFGNSVTKRTASYIYTNANVSNKIRMTEIQRSGFNKKNKDEMVFVDYADSNHFKFKAFSVPNNIFASSYINAFDIEAKSKNPINIVGNNNVLFCFSLDSIPQVSFVDDIGGISETGVKPPSASRVFVDAAAYLRGKDIYMIFVGTGIIFSRTLEEGSFGYLDTTSVLGTITQFGYLDYSQDENTLYLLGQDTNNHVKVAKMKLNTLYDYANDGAWLPMIASDGVPAYIKAKEPDTEEAAT